MNPMHDYMVRMTKDQLLTAKVFCSVMLNDLKNGFFIPNEREKYRVGDNADMKLSEDSRIGISITAHKPKGIPDENWLPINRENEDLGVKLRIYVPVVRG